MIPASVLCGRSGLSTFNTTGRPSLSDAATASSALCAKNSLTTGTPYSARTSFASRSVRVAFLDARRSDSAAALAEAGDNRACAGTKARRFSSRHIQALRVAKQFPIERNNDTFRVRSISAIPGPPIHSLTQTMQIGLPASPARKSNAGMRCTLSSDA